MTALKGFTGYPNSYFRMQSPIPAARPPGSLGFVLAAFLKLKRGGGKEDWVGCHGPQCQRLIVVVDDPLEIWSTKSYSRTDDSRTLVLGEEWEHW